MRHRNYLIVLFLAAIAILPVWGGRTANGTSDYLQASMGTNRIFPANISTQAQGTVSFVLNLIALPTGGGSIINCGVHCAEIVNVIAGHNAAVNGCTTITGACLDIFVCGSTTTFCTINEIVVDITTPNVGEAETSWPVSLGRHNYAFLLNRTAANMQLYTDGALTTIRGSGQNSDPGPINYAGALCGGALCDFTLMASQGGGGTPSPDNFTNGIIGDLGIWNLTLSTNEIQSLANCLPPNRIQPDHLAWWPIWGTDSPEPEYEPFGAGFLLKLILHGTISTPGNQAGCAPGGAFR